MRALRPIRIEIITNVRDFTLDIYRELLETLLSKGYVLIPYSKYRHSDIATSQMFVILRHDVDAKSGNSLKTAQIEHSLGVKATYYFRKPASGDMRRGNGKGMTEPEYIRAIVALGHEIGYHYEDLSLCNGNMERAYNHFATWLDYFRQYYAVETICMHGAPTSKWDNKDLWKQYDYASFGIIGEPYLDTDFNDVFYLTDTGRCWDGYKVSLRDKIPGHQDKWTQQGLTWHTTQQLIETIRQDRFPNHVMLTTHPQRWTNSRGEWWKEWILQKTKNIFKRILLWKTRS